MAAVHEPTLSVPNVKVLHTKIQTVGANTVLIQVVNPKSALTATVLQVPRTTDHEQMVHDIRVGTLGMRRDDEVDLRAGKVWVLNVDMDGQPCDAYISQKNSALWVNVGALGSGSKGDAFYQIAGGGNALNFTLALVHPGTFLGQEKFTFKQLSELFLVLPWLPVTIHAMV